MLLDRKKVEEAAKRCFNTATKGITDKDEALIAFKCGAHWAIQEFLKDLWHDASEEPRMFAEVVAEAKITESINTYISFKKSDALFTNWTAYSHGASITRWLYIDDLFPKQKGGSE
mgnify:FL=1